MSQLSLPIHEFYQALSIDDRQYAQGQAQEIRLEQHNTAVRIGDRLISVKERLGHGSFGKWIKLEFEWSERQAQMLMKIASEIGNAKDTSDLPTATMPLYALASAMSKEDEDGKQELLDAYHEKAQEKGSALSEKEIKELKAKLREKEGEVNTLKQSNQFVTSQLKEQQELVKTANSMMLAEAEKIAEKKVASEVKKATQDLRDELTGLTNKINSLEKEKASAERNSELAKANYEKALEHFKLNPDPETQKAIIELKNTYERTKAQVEMVAISLNELKNKEDQAFSASLSLERFNVAFQKLISNHPDAITAMSSRYLTDASLALIETLADTLDDWAHTIRNSLEMAREEKAKHIEALEVDVVSTPINYFPEPEDEDEW